MTNINAVSLKKFITKTLGIHELKLHDLNKFDINKSDFSKADVDVNSNVDIDEILENDELYEQFAVLYTEQQDKLAEAEEKEEEKEVKAEVGNNSGTAA